MHVCVGGLEGSEANCRQTPIGRDSWSSSAIVFMGYFPPHLLTNTLCSFGGLFSAGNFKQIFNPQSWAFHQSLVDRYGGVAKIYGVFGVSKLHYNITSS